MNRKVLHLIQYFSTLITLTTCFRDKQILLHVLGVGTLSRVMKVYIRYELKTAEI